MWIGDKIGAFIKKHQMVKKLKESAHGVSGGDTNEIDGGNKLWKRC